MMALSMAVAVFPSSIAPFFLMFFLSTFRCFLGTFSVKQAQSSVELLRHFLSYTAIFVHEEEIAV